MARPGAVMNSTRAELVSIQALFPASRSEERRVGKECRSRCDWSSDVCSSDLVLLAHEAAVEHGEAGGRHEQHEGRAGKHPGIISRQQIGRASCRERV